LIEVYLRGLFTGGQAAPPGSCPIGPGGVARRLFARDKAKPSGNMW
jgi:hypothetical protein